MPKKVVFDKYQRRAPSYHWQQVSRNIFRLNAFVLARYQQVIKLIPRQKNLRILDIGCGDGVLLSLIGRGRLYGVDIDQDGLNYAATRVKDKLINAPAESLPFRSVFFDIVIATEIIEHLTNPDLMLTEIKRVLRRGGRVIITTPIKPAVGLTDKLHYQEFTPEALKRLCRQYFQAVTVRTSHPIWLKNVYTRSWGRLGRFYLDSGRWLINLIVIISGWNPFLSLPGQPSQQIVTGRKS
jgi:ubiquinone/menaquinone biosynthesis C-methylase UbiE